MVEHLATERCLGSPVGGLLLTVGPPTSSAQARFAHLQLLEASRYNDSRRPRRNFCPRLTLPVFP